MHTNTHVVITYTNHRGETEERLVRPINMHFSTSPFYDEDEPQWLVEAFCEERNDQRSFALTGIESTRVANEDDLARLEELVLARAEALPSVSEPEPQDEDALTTLPESE